MKKRIVSLFLICALFVSIFSVSVSAATVDAQENVPSVSDEVLQAEAAYRQNLKSYGLTDADIDYMQELIAGIATASSTQEANALMKEYRALIADTPLAASTSFSSEDGGTLYLNFTGTPSLLGFNLVYTKFVYLNEAQVIFFLRSLNDTDIWSKILTILNQYTGAGQKITTYIANKLAPILGISTVEALGLTGMSIAACIELMDWVDKTSFNMAVDESTTGKVMIMYYYTYVAPEYEMYLGHSYEPWNSNTIEVPEDYDHNWDEGVYDF